MNIYIPIEVKSRELEGRLLLALAAAERGHDVLIGRKTDTITLAMKGLLQPGIIHDKCLTPSVEKVQWLDRLSDNGHRVTSQDEESGLLEPTYEEFAVNRYSADTISRADAVFTWGHFERDALARMFPEATERLEVTGSPRVDYWRPELSEYFQERPKSILFVSNFGWVLGVNPFWVKLEVMRKGGYFQEIEDEYRRYELCAWKMKLLRHFVQVIQTVADAFPDSRVVVRPHPIDDVRAWHTLLPDWGNIEVTREGSASGWIRNAEALIHNGCTTGLEAAAVGIPTIAYRPIPSPFELEYPNSVSRQASTDEAVLEHLRDVRDARPAAASNGHVREILDKKLSSLDGPLAADRMVDAWERMDDSRLDTPNNWFAVRARVKGIEARSGVARIASRVGLKLGSSNHSNFQNAQKFPPMTDQEVMSIVDGLRRTLDRFHQIELQRLGRRSFRVTSKRGD